MSNSTINTKKVENEQVSEKGLRDEYETNACFVTVWQQKTPKYILTLPVAF
jgi:hypothetical protein